MKLVIIKHVHSCFASVASGDIWLYRVFENVDENGIKKHIKKLAKGYERVDDDIANIVSVYVDSDKTFYEKGLHTKGMPSFAGTPDFLALIDQYKKEGWIDEPIDVRQAREAKREREYIAEAARRKAAGYVFSGYKRIEKFDGGFSEKLLNVPSLATYIKNSGNFGYIGHFGRKFVTDAYLEKEFMRLNVPEEFNKTEILATWLTSTDGRHFCDSIEDDDDDVAKNKIKKYLPEIFNLGFIYSREEHGGSGADTQALRKKYADKLLAEGA